jgi:hypothetical protein
MVLFVLTGVFSMVSSAIFLPHQLTVGASGAAMGMLGCQWANLIMNWSVLDAPARQVPVLMLTVATEVRLTTSCPAHSNRAGGHAHTPSLVTPPVGRHRLPQVQLHLLTYARLLPRF